jgi:hypothetical protein
VGWHTISVAKSMSRIRFIVSPGDEDSVRPVRLTSSVLSDEGRSVENKLARALGVESSAVRQYVSEVLEERLVRGRTRSERRTGFRMVRGSHGCTYVRDPNGIDMLPPGVEPPPERASAGRAA